MRDVAAVASTGASEASASPGIGDMILVMGSLGWHTTVEDVVGRAKAVLPGALGDGAASQAAIAPMVERLGAGSATDLVLVADMNPAVRLKDKADLQSSCPLVAWFCLSPNAPRPRRGASTWCTDLTSIEELERSRSLADVIATGSRVAGLRGGGACRPRAGTVWRSAQRLPAPRKARGARLGAGSCVVVAANIGQRGGSDAALAVALDAVVLPAGRWTLPSYPSSTLTVATDAPAPRGEKCGALMEAPGLWRSHGAFGRHC